MNADKGSGMEVELVSKRKHGGQRYGRVNKRKRGAVLLRLDVCAHSLAATPVFHDQFVCRLVGRS